MKKNQAIWMVLACVLTLQALPTSAASADGTSGPGEGKVSAGISLYLKCTGQVSSTTLTGEASASLLELGPLRILTFQTRVAFERIHWQYSCTASQEVSAFGWGGLMQEVTVATLQPNGDLMTRAACSYSGAVDGTLPAHRQVRSSCAARYSTGSKVVQSDSGTAAPNEEYVGEVQVCAEFGAYGETHTILLDPSATSLVWGYCEKVAIDYEKAGSGGGPAAEIEGLTGLGMPS